ncbi:hypothetical protein [Salipiger mucosus]|uniref:DUF4148 domain-containing protein n=1 Tax=Salipiger mucosus DSM 16094 TaxID=1123237 RepID=S9SKM2_9RHOB|nr:hypothetical protein [Salipiger mucosus]EPX86929.1 hypothetical protein Salmuc_01581 [Salipiger mucosus DSM 16094]
MSSKHILGAAFCVACTLGSAVAASHANPWATSDDEVTSQYHEANQARSIGTPGEDEMKGVMVRRASGKLGGSASERSGGGGHGGGHGRR